MITVGILLSNMNIDDDEANEMRMIIADIKTALIEQHIVETLDMAQSALADKGKTLADMPIMQVEEMGNESWNVLHSVTADAQPLDTTKFGAIQIIFDDADKREFSRIYRHTVLTAVSKQQRFLQDWA